MVPFIEITFVLRFLQLFFSFGVCVVSYRLMESQSLSPVNMIDPPNKNSACDQR
jgi:hypothetical protein